MREPNKHGVEGETYPVASGEVWQVGRHVYLCCDLMDEPSSLRRLLIEIEAGGLATAVTPTLMYTDPPWGPGLAKSFRTTAGLGAPDYDWTDIYVECSDIAEFLGVPIFAECSAADTKVGMQVPHALTRGGYPTRGGYQTHRGYWPISYFGGNAAGLYYAGEEAPPSELVIAGADAAGMRVPATVLAQYPVGTLLDPCGGLGGIPLVAQRAGWASISSELSPYRMSAAMARMNKTSGDTPRRVRQW